MFTHFKWCTIVTNSSIGNIIIFNEYTHLLLEFVDFPIRRYLADQLKTTKIRQQ